MPVYLVALAESLAYLCAVPVCVALRLTAGSVPGARPPSGGDPGLRLGVGAGVFASRGAIRRAERRQAPLAAHGNRRGPELWPLLRRLSIERVRLEGRLCLGDAAATALACGAVNALAGAVPVERPAQSRVLPDFAAADAYCALRATLRFRAGALLLAALKTAAR